MPSTKERTWRAGRFWWDWPERSDTVVYPLRAMVFDLDALADIECGGHRLAFNAAFAAHGLDFEWSVARYRQLLALRDERQRVAAELRARGVCTESDVLTALLVDEICTTKAMVFQETILDADLAPRRGLIDLVTDAFTAGVGIGIV
ncbi:MAG: haloacid dehalogenase, partial [Mycobacteriaceae bacterium]|nr:haloacid dehalogenase [Mycobacteriaceae bacterium]